MDKIDQNDPYYELLRQAGEYERRHGLTQYDAEKFCEFVGGVSIISAGILAADRHSPKEYIVAGAVGIAAVTARLLLNGRNPQ